MNLTKQDGLDLIGAIAVELESHHWRKEKREQNRLAMWRQTGNILNDDTEKYLVKEDAKRAERLRELRDKIKKQIKGKP